MAQNNAPPLNQFISAMLGALTSYLPAPAPPLPNPSVSVGSVTERAVGLGNRRGNESRGPFAVIALKGGRLDVVVRFQLWAGEPETIHNALRDLHQHLLDDYDTLRAAGFLRLALQSSSLPEYVPATDAWLQSAEYSILYEFHYQDTDGAESLIARIPITIDREHGESMVVTDALVRWDNESAPVLVVRGRFTIGGLAALVFIPGPAPNGAVTMTRRLDGAAGPPTVFTELTAFLAAIADPVAPSRHAQVTVPTLSDFLNAFSAVGDPVTLGDWNVDGVPDSYQPRQLALEPTVQLLSTADRLEIAYQGIALNQVGVMYLRVV